MNVIPRRLALWGVVLIVLALIVLGLRARPVSVSAALAERGPLEVTIDEEGETRVRERFVVSAPVAGRVLRIVLEPGDPVRAQETLLATFQPSDPTLLDARSRAEAESRVKAARAALGRARAERERGQAELDYARSELGRYGRLAEQGVVSRERLEQAERLLRTDEEARRAAGYAVASAQHELDVARARLLQAEGGPALSDGPEPMALRSPIDGVVLRRLRQSEAIVPAGEPLLELADPAALEIVADLLSSDAVRVRTGQRVHLEQWGGDETLPGRVRRVEPSGFTKISALGVEEKRVNVIIDFEEPGAASELLGDGYRVEVRVVVWESDDVLKVPTGGLFRQGEDWAVYVIEGDRASLRSVGIDHSNGLEAEVISGLEAGDRVVLHPSDSVEDGVKVEVRGS